MAAPKRRTARGKGGSRWLGCSLELTGLVALAALTIVYATWYRPALRPVDPTTRKTQLLKVTAGEGLKHLCADLHAKGLIRNARAAWLYGKISGRGRRLKAGYYDVSAAMSARDFLVAISKGKVATRRVTVVPGLTLRQIAARVQRAGLAKAADFIDEARTDAFIGETGLGLPHNMSVEGYLLPDTYTFRVGSPVHEMILAMLEAFQRHFVQPNEADLRKNPLGLHKIVTIASMIEREAMVDKERPIIAGVIMNRLHQGMRLQIDATVQYALGHHKTRIMQSDLAVNSPYNTYLHGGLPPGPICSPGMPSLRAALHPAKVPYLFYVANGKGTHLFAQTYKEHLANIARVRGGGH